MVGLDGQPAANVAVKAYLVSDLGSGLLTENGSGVVSNNSGNLITDHGSGVVSNNAGNIIANHAGGFFLLADAAASGAEATASGAATVTGPSTAILTTVTDAHGVFSLSLPAGQQANVEAVQSEAVKAIAQRVAGTDGLSLQLAYTGAIAGHVKSNAAKDLTGVDVFIPGTSYDAKCAPDGSYTISNVPVGSFTLVAMHTGLGKGAVDGVKVAPQAVNPAPDLNLVIKPPVITGVTPANGGPGSSVTITGHDFGFTDGSTFAVHFGGATASNPARQDDGTIIATVPAGATTGDLVVEVDGIQSQPSPFTALASVTFPPNPGYLPLGFNQPFPALTFDNSGKLVASPALKWASDGPAITADAKGQVKAVAAGKATLTATSGNTSASQAYTVVNEPVLYTLAGGDALDYKDGPGKDARFKWLGAVAVDTRGLVFVADFQNNAIRSVRADGLVATAAGGPNSTLHLGSNNAAGGLAVDDQDNLYTCAGFTIVKLAPDGTSTTLAGGDSEGTIDGPGPQARFENIAAIARDPAGNLYVAEGDDPRFKPPYTYVSAHRVRKIAPDGTTSTLAGSTDGHADGPGATALFSNITSLGVDGQGNVYASDAGGLRKITPAGVVTTIALPQGAMPGSRIAVDAAGDIYLADFYTGGNSQVSYRLVKPDGTATVLTSIQGWGKSANGPGSVASDWGAMGLALDPNGDLVIANYEDEANTAQVKRLLLTHAPS